MLRLTTNLSNAAVTSAHTLLLSGVLLLTASNTLAEHQATSLPSVAFGTTGTALSIDENGSDTGQIDFEIDLVVPVSTGSFSLLLEGGAVSPQPVSCGAQTVGDMQAFTPGSGDARVLELSYRVSHHTGDWTIGIQEARGTIDTSQVANDDKTQFLASAFVNNPTIILPESSLGLSWRRAIGTGRRGIGVTAARYDSSGAFLAAESWWDFDHATARIGAWHGREGINCDGHPHESLDGHGVYASIDKNTQHLHWNLRLGWGSHGEVPVSFIGLAVEFPLARGTLGAALGQSRGVTHEEAPRERLVEMYYRYSLPNGLTLLPGLQLSDRRRDSSGYELTAGLRFGIGI